MQVDGARLFKLLTKETRDAMFNVAYLVLESSEAEDAVAEAVGYVLARCQRAPIEMRNPTAYLVRCARNQALRLARQHRRHTPADNSPIGDNQQSVFGGSRVAADEQSNAQSVILECLERLPEPYHEMIVLQHWANISVGQIASMFGLAQRTAERDLARARQLLKRCIDDTRSGGPE